MSKVWLILYFSGHVVGSTGPYDDSFQCYSDIDSLMSKFHGSTHDVYIDGFDIDCIASKTKPLEEFKF